MEQRIYNCLIVDDEPLAQNLLENFVGRLPFLKLIGKSNHALAAMDAIHQFRPDIVFLDITMPEMTGFELLRTLSIKRPQIIITTAHVENAVEGFAYDVTDFLVKPIPFDHFLRSVNRAIDRLNGIASSPKENIPTDDQYFWIKEGTKLLQINTNDVTYIEGLKDYVKVQLKDRMVITYLTMTRMEELLPKGQFIRINRSYLVRKKSIRAIQGNAVETTTNHELIIGGSYRSAVIDALRDSFIGRTTLE